MSDSFIIHHIKIYNIFYKNIIESEIKSFNLQNSGYLIEDCCDNNQIQFLLSVIKEYTSNKKMNGNYICSNDITLKISIAAILYYYYHVVLIETHYNDYLETIHVKNLLFEYLNDGKAYYIFIKLTNNLIYGDDVPDVTVRQKFLFMNETNILTK
jgi:hypothetical protein